MDEIQRIKRKLDYASEDSVSMAGKVVESDLWGQLGTAALWFGAFIIFMLFIFFLFAALRK